MMKHFIFFAILLAQTFAFADQSQCLDKKAVARIQARFSITAERNPDLCDPEKSYNYKIINALLFAETLDLSGPETPSPWSQDILPKNWLNYIEQRASQIAGGSQDPYSPYHCQQSPNVVAYVNHYISDAMFMCKLAFHPSYGVMDLLETMMHEARHQDGHGYGHSTCTRGPFSGDEGGCDEEVTDKGSYAVSMEAAAKFAVSAKNLHPTQKKTALYAALGWESRFNVPFFTNMPFALLVDNSGRTHYFDGKNLSVIDASHVPVGKIQTRWAGQFVVYPDDKTQAAKRFLTYDGVTLTPAADEGSLMQDYRNQSFEDRNALKDLVYDYSVDGFSAQIRGLQVIIHRAKPDRTYENQTLKNDFGVPVHIFTSRDLNASAKNRVYILNEQGQLFRIEILPGTSKVTLIDNPVPGITAITNLGAKKFALNTAGQLLTKTEAGYVVMKDFQDRRFTQLTRNSEQSKTAKKLFDAHALAVRELPQ